MIWQCNWFHTHTHAHKHTHTHTHTRMHTNTHTHTYTHTHAHTHACTHTCTHTRTHTRAHTHIYTHTYTLQISVSWKHTLRRHWPAPYIFTPYLLLHAIYSSFIVVCNYTPHLLLYAITLTPEHDRLWLSRSRPLATEIINPWGQSLAQHLFRKHAVWQAISKYLIIL